MLFDERSPTAAMVELIGMIAVHTNRDVLARHNAFIQRAGKAETPAAVMAWDKLTAPHVLSEQ